MNRGTSNSQTSKFSLVFSHEVLSLCASQFPILRLPPGAGIEEAGRREAAAGGPDGICAGFQVRNGSFATLTAAPSPRPRYSTTLPT